MGPRQPRCDPARAREWREWPQWKSSWRLLAQPYDQLRLWQPAAGGDAIHGQGQGRFVVAPGRSLRVKQQGPRLRGDRAVGHARYVPHAHALSCLDVGSFVDQRIEYGTMLVVSVR